MIGLRKPSRFLNPIMLVTFFHFPKIPFQQLTPTPHSPLFPLQAAPREVQADQGRTVATPMAVALPTDPTQKILSSMTSLLLNGPLGAPRWLVGGRWQIMEVATAIVSASWALVEKPTSLKSV